MGMRENETPHFPICRREPARQWCYISFSGTSADSDILDCHRPPGKKRRVFNLRISATQKTTNNNAALNWQNMSSRGMGAAGNGNNQLEGEGNGNTTRLNLGSGMGMGMNRWQWEGM